METVLTNVRVFGITATQNGHTQELKHIDLPEAGKEVPVTIEFGETIGKAIVTKKEDGLYATVTFTTGEPFPVQGLYPSIKVMVDDTTRLHSEVIELSFCVGRNIDPSIKPIP